VRDLDDATMLRIMANENAGEWTMDTAVLMETIKSTEKFVGNVSHEKKRGSLAEEITEFLGGVFTEGMVKNALAIIHAVERNEIDKKAVKTIPEPSKALKFSQAIQKYRPRATPQKQREIAQAIVTEETPHKEIESKVRFFDIKPAEMLRLKAKPDVRDFLAENRWKVKQITEYCNQLNEVKSELNGLEWVTFRAACVKLQYSLARLLGDEIGGKEVNVYGKAKKAIEDKSSRRVSK
jgi:uncharacterized membrane-anchored protein YjiN (DUF445 family)